MSRINLDRELRRSPATTSVCVHVCQTLPLLLMLVVYGQFSDYVDCRTVAGLTGLVLPEIHLKVFTVWQTVWQFVGVVQSLLGHCVTYFTVQQDLLDQVQNTTKY